MASRRKFSEEYKREAVLLVSQFSLSLACRVRHIPAAEVQGSWALHSRPTEVFR